MERTPQHDEPGGRVGLEQPAEGDGIGGGIVAGDQDRGTGQQPLDAIGRRGGRAPKLVGDDCGRDGGPARAEGGRVTVRQDAGAESGQALPPAPGERDGGAGPDLGLAAGGPQDGRLEAESGAADGYVVGEDGAQGGGGASELKLRPSRGDMAGQGGGCPQFEPVQAGIHPLIKVLEEIA